MRRKGREGEARDNKHVRNTGKVSRGKARPEEELYELLLEDSSQPALILVLDCVQDPHNLGAILRTADGAGVTAVVAPKDKSAGITDTVRRISVGAADAVPFFQVTNLSRTMSKLQEAGVWLVGTSDAGKGTLYETDFTGPIGIVMGAEGDGMRRLTQDSCDFLIQIPMAGKVECLNVSVATAVCLYEAVRQRMALKSD
ncbi:MAG: 23S rRNA (guanosine(2251)-2'-O)-methyltransferase RlmB [Akkermansiaceae bacterium]